jgi:hypothetical protein
MESWTLDLFGSEYRPASVFREDHNELAGSRKGTEFFNYVDY